MRLGCLAALGLYRTKETLEPGNATVHAHMGMTLYFLDRHEAVLASVECALRLDPYHETARNLSEQLRAVAPGFGPLPRVPRLGWKSQRRIWRG